MTVCRSENWNKLSVNDWRSSPPETSVLQPRDREYRCKAHPDPWFSQNKNSASIIRSHHRLLTAKQLIYSTTKHLRHTNHNHNHTQHPVSKILSLIPLLLLSAVPSRKSPSPPISHLNPQPSNPSSRPPHRPRPLHQLLQPPRPHLPPRFRVRPPGLDHDPTGLQAILSVHVRRGEEDEVPKRSAVQPRSKEVEV